MPERTVSVFIPGDSFSTLLETALQYQKPVLIQEQKMKLSPQMYQSIQLMALPVQELKFRIQEEVEKNPALEVVEQNNSISIDDIPKKNSDDDDYFENSSDPGLVSSQSSEEGDSKRMFIEGALSRPDSLQDHMLGQLRVQPVREPVFRIGELLIQNLDENGFNISKPELLAKGFAPEDLKEAISLVRILDPQGTCTDDFRHSLVVQAQMRSDIPEHTIEIIEEYFDLLEKGKYREISRKIRISEKEVENVLDFIKTLNPFPGRQFSTETSTYVIPDLMIRVVDNELVIRLNEEEIPVLEISRDFEEILKENNEIADKKTKSYINSRIKEGKWFIQTINLRNQTLLKTAAAIASFQKEFFIRGPKYLAPLTLKDISEKVGVHETTISRISTSKYVQTDWGIFELKYFFSTALSRTDSRESMVSRVSVKHMLKEIIDTEGKSGHLSDQNLADFLKDKKGIKIARRTVAKYRKELDIASSYER